MAGAVDAVRATLGALAVLAAAGSSFSAEVEPALWSRLQRIEGAFRGGDAGALRPSLPAAAKVRVDLKGLTDGPVSYGPGQLQVVFGQIFDSHRTRQFAFRKEDVTIPTRGTAFARARWVRSRRPGGQEIVDTLTVTLRAEAGDWRVHEILSSR